ncbi:hypothetical protein MM221_07985 [Salipaludibacillus sp. LMS25]|jgi:uncharacterized protein YycO|uniref:YiiX/YebB-like N1pC/P60 family cysteine hydrolase n=1 Tax=Salipaludibacillus sp. LMS25 TaxID=2924031 RepID=UPI0020D1DF20|nr:YiiX/YebB-like N1pC/P60 family cysteine hydrolase [Salipaludibacillus sp. LMS25]UTR16470.1 hypothetical protein MM221_07985 [Salipaludibacillus sp. LMS25]
MLKKLMFLVLFIFIGSLFFYSNTSFAKEANGEDYDLSEENFEQLIVEGYLPGDISYDEWVEINDESLFDELEVPNVVLDTDDTDGIMTYAKASKTFTLKKGDILVSNGTSYKGLTGHAGIAISSNRILHIAGPNKKPAVVSVKAWQKNYGIVKGQRDGITHTKVYRVSNNSAGKAGDWASKNYKGKNYKYGFGGKITSKNPTYCSKIVWQAYNNQNKAKKPKTKIIGPYQLPTHITGAKGLGIL